MNIVDIIQDLKQYKTENKKTDDKNIYKSIQHNFLEGYIGAIMNNDTSDDTYEVCKGYSKRHRFNPGKQH